MIERDLGVKLPVDEAASIALHIVNAEYDAPMGDTIKITNLIQQVLEVVREYFSIELDEQSSAMRGSSLICVFWPSGIYRGAYESG